MRTSHDNSTTLSSATSHSTINSRRRDSGASEADDSVEGMVNGHARTSPLSRPFSSPPSSSFTSPPPTSIIVGRLYLALAALSLLFLLLFLVFIGPQSTLAALRSSLSPSSSLSLSPSSLPSTPRLSPTTPCPLTPAHPTRPRYDASSPLVNAFNPYLKLIAIGDSITEFGAREGGWLLQLITHYNRRADVYNRGYSGYNTRNYLYVLRQQLHHNLFPFAPSLSPPPPTTAPDPTEAPPRFANLVTLYLGTNDAAIGSTVGHEAALHVPLAEFTANLRHIIALLVPEYAPVLAEGSTPPGRYLSTVTALLLVTPAQLDEKAWAYRDKQPPYPPLASLAPLARMPNVTALYAEAVRAVGAQWGIPVLDMWALTPPDADGQRVHFSDGLHLNAQGNRVLSEALVKAVADFYPQLSVPTLMFNAPSYWDLHYLPPNADPTQETP